MKTRTLLLLSVGTALAILLAGGVLLLQLSSEAEPARTASIGDDLRVGDLTVTVLDTDDTGDRFVVTVRVAGVDDADGASDFRLVTGDQQLGPIAAPAEGRCAAFTVAPQECRLEFDTGSVESSSRVLVARRGDQQVAWTLG